MPDLPKMPAVKVPDASAIMRKASRALDSIPDASRILDKQRAEPVPDPLAGVEYTGSLEEDAARELTALEQGYRDRAAREDDRFTEATDTEHWFAVCFRTRADKDAFLERFQLEDLGNKYLDGSQVAKRLQR